MGGALFVVAIVLAAPSLLVAQIHGIPPSVTSVQNHFLPYLPNVAPSVTSLGPNGYVGPPAFPVYPRYPRSGRGGYGHHDGNGNGLGYLGYGGVYAVPIYVPATDPAYGDDAGVGGYLYSEPPEQALHAVVDMPPAKRDPYPIEEEPVAPVAKSQPPAPREVMAIDSTVLVFRDGHRQQVTNYAVMGQTLYVFDGLRQKIALGDLDVPATIKVNDDRGVEFQLPGPASS